MKNAVRGNFLSRFERSLWSVSHSSILRQHINNSKHSSMVQFEVCLESFRIEAFTGLGDRFRIV